MFHEKHENNSDLVGPFVGYFCSAALIFAAYYLANKLQMPNWALIFMVIGIAVIQTAIQMLTFLNLRKEKKPRWAQMTSFFSVLVVCIVFIGSLWIMWNLRYNMKPSPTLMESKY